jgi:hypothetical protein
MNLSSIKVMNVQRTPTGRLRYVFNTDLEKGLVELLFLNWNTSGKLVFQCSRVSEKLWLEGIHEF